VVILADANKSLQ